jgi:hypothetical protein
MSPKVPRNPLDRIRELCLALPETTELRSHGQPTFFIGGKRSFVMYLDNHHGDGAPRDLVCRPRGHAAGAGRRRAGALLRPPYVGHRGWLGIRLDQGIDWNEVAGAVEDAYLTVAPRRLVEAVGEAPE